MHETERGAVLRSNRVEILHGPEPAGARHALNDDPWIAWNVRAEIRSEGAGVGRDAAPLRGARNEIDSLTFVEIGDRICERGLETGGQGSDHCERGDVGTDHGTSGGVSSPTIGRLDQA